MSNYKIIYLKISLTKFFYQLIIQNIDFEEESTL